MYHFVDLSYIYLHKQNSKKNKNKKCFPIKNKFLLFAHVLPSVGYIRRVK